MLRAAAASQRNKHPDGLGYLTMSFRAALAEVWHHNATLAFGVVGGGLGAVVAATQNGFLPLPLGIVLGLYVALWVVLLRVRQEREDLRTQLALAVATDPFDIAVDIGGYYAEANGPNCSLPGTWVVFHDVAVTNRSKAPLPLELWLQLGMRPDDSWRMGCVCASSYPAWALQDEHESQPPLGRFVNLPALHTESGICLANFGADVVAIAGATDLSALVHQHPFWLEIKNKLTNDTRLFPVNAVAKRLAVTQAAAPSQG